MLKGKKIAIIGGGKMGSIIAHALVSRKIVSVHDLTITDVDAARLKHLRTELGLKASSDNKKAVKSADVVILAVKPQSMAQTLKEIASSVTKAQIIISIAAGITASFIEDHLTKGARVVRVMPNTPALVGAGAAAVSKGKFASAADIKLARTIFDAVGITVEVEEKLMDAVTGLSGSGPAYCFLMIEALADAGVQMGLPRDLALQMSAQTMYGSAHLCLKGDKHPAELRDMVTSPAGTTAAGLKVLEEGKLRAILMSAVEAATKRSKELSGGRT